MSNLNPASLGDLPDPIEFEQIAASDTLIEQIAHRYPPPGDPLAADLARWLDRLDAELHASQLPGTCPGDSRLEATQSRSSATPSRVRAGAAARRRLVVATVAASVLALAGTGVAAAAPGSFLYPAHQVIFGGPSADERLLADATKSLDQAQKIITTARGQFVPSAGELAKARELLTGASSLLAEAPASAPRTALLVRWQQLSDSLAALTPTSPGQPTKHSQPRPQTSTSPSPGASSDAGGGNHTSEGGDQADTGGGDGNSGSPSSGPSTDGTDGRDGNNSSTPPTSSSGDGASTSGDGAGNGGSGQG